MKKACSWVVRRFYPRSAGPRPIRSIYRPMLTPTAFIDVQALTCAQLANTYQSDANVLMAWYSGWYNGLGHKHYMDYKKGRELEHLVIEYCKAHQDERIIHAIAVNLKDMRAEGMMQEK